MNDAYDDIINLPRHVSSKHPKMSHIDRAAQFSPFAALTGHSAAIRETARLTEDRIDVTNEAKLTLDRKLDILIDISMNEPEVTITYFQPDKKKQGGSYISATGIIKKVDNYVHTITMTNGTVIPIKEVLEIESEVFEPYF